VHLTSELLKKRAGIDIVHVPYKGSGPSVAAVVAGDVQMVNPSIASTIAFINTGKLRALATTGAKRSSMLPDVPTVAESGYPGFESIQWFCLMVPAGTPKPIVARIRDEAIKTLKMPEVRAAMARLGIDPETSTPEDLAVRIRMETSLWSEIVKDAGIQPE
jgi:tripartite-type tricarboxylate transporter receptor subunit TctC